MNKNRFGCLIVVLVVLLCFSVLFNIALVSAKSRRIGTSHLLTPRAPEFDEQTVVNASASTGDKIALIPLRGIISASRSGSLGETMVEDFKIELRQALEDGKVKAIVLNIDSPGGEVTASDEIYSAVKKARAIKPVVVYMSSLAASGGYYVSCAGTWLMANETTITGSIGVIIETLNYQQLFGKLGLDMVVFKSGQFKDILSGARQMTPEEKEYIQNMVMQTYGKFVGIVARERGLPEEQLRTGIADGRIISGRDALGYKLINQLGQIEDAYQKARDLGHAPGAAVIRYQPGFKLGRLFRMLGQSETSKIELNIGDGLVPKLESGRLYLLPGFYAP